MKGLRLSLMVLAAIFLALGFSGMAYAFHAGGVAECEGCHTMHNSLNGSALTKNTPVGVTNNYLLIGSDASSTCLNCHAADASEPGSYHIMTYPVPGAGSAPVNNSPGGDFAWLQKYRVHAFKMVESHSFIDVAFSFFVDPDGVGLVIYHAHMPAGSIVHGSY